jgi:anti-anti-sigma regulatory factor
VVASRAGDVVIDLAEVDFINTATVLAFAEGQQLLYRRGRKLTFRSPSRLAARLLDLFELSDLIEAEEGAQS